MKTLIWVALLVLSTPGLLTVHFAEGAARKFCPGSFLPAQQNPLPEDLFREALREVQLVRPDGTVELTVQVLDAQTSVSAGTVDFKFIDAYGRAVGHSDVFFDPLKSLCILNRIYIDDVNYQSKGLAGLILKLMLESVPSGTRLFMTSTNSQTNDVLKPIYRSVKELPRYKALHAKNPKQAETFLNQEFSRRVFEMTKNESRSVLWIHILKKSGWVVEGLSHNQQGYEIISAKP